MRAAILRQLVIATLKGMVGYAAFFALVDWAEFIGK